MAMATTSVSHFSLSDTEEDEEERDRPGYGQGPGEAPDFGLPIFLNSDAELDLELYLPPSVFKPEESQSSSRGNSRAGSRSGTTTPRNGDLPLRNYEAQRQEEVEIEIPTEDEGEAEAEAVQAGRDGVNMGQHTGDTMKEIQVPTHPIPSMQEAFAESMLEANAAATPSIPKNRQGNAAARRKLLLDQDVGEETHAARWRQRPGQQYHELWKLMAQISFGVYLLMKGIAKDDDQVMNILQGHVDEVDEFLETTLEDFDLAQEDIEERLKFLKLPLENIIIFDAMLEDRNFRLQIVSGNERIEHVITRTATAMNDALKDVQQGLDACKEFTIYLAQEEKNAIWMRERPDMQKVFEAMKGNVEGWYKAYVSLQTKGNYLGVALVQLGSIVAEMDRRAGDISRKSRFSTTPATVPMASPPVSPPQSKEMRQSMSKNLPSDPNLITPAIRATLPAFQLVQDRERTPEPENASETSSDVEAPEPDFILKPRTYSPAPSPKPPSAPVVQEPPPPEITKRSSLRKRFSLKRKENADVPRVEPPDDDYWGPRQRVLSSAAREREREISMHEQTRPRESTLNQRPREISIHERERPRESTLNQRPGDLLIHERERPRERTRESNFGRPLDSNFDRPRESPLNTPPSRGFDSAYCSDFEKTSSPSAIPPNIPLHQTQSHTSSTCHSHTHSRPFHHNPIPSPLSDKQFFRPVQASPNSPLQRPWTAGPSNPLHMHSNSSTSNLSQRNNYHAHTPSQLGNRRGAPSAMGFSVMSDMTMMTDIETGKKVKKKRSAFGWLKKAFSLSEEEKRVFEERRLEAEVERERERDRRVRGEGRRWVDGKRVGPPGGGLNGGGGGGVYGNMGGNGSGTSRSRV